MNQKGREKKVKTTQETSGIKVDGIDNVMVSLGSCCHPLPGDKVIGIVNSGRGIVIHTANCVIAKQIAESAPGKVVRVEFQSSGRVYNAKIRVSVEDRPGMLANVSSVIAKFKINIISVSVRRSSTGRAVMDFVIQVKNKDELENLLRSIRGIKGVIVAKRIYRERIKRDQEN